MVPIVDQVIMGGVAVLLLIVLRWIWFRNERKRLIALTAEGVDVFGDGSFGWKKGSPPTNAQVHRVGNNGTHPNDDEGEEDFQGRVIQKLRYRIEDGGIFINWIFKRDYIHKGFVLNADMRMPDGSWVPVGLAPQEDSGKWRDEFEYGASRTYRFTVSKTYHFFFHLFPGDDVTVIYDQISFSARRNRKDQETKAMASNVRYLEELRSYVKLEIELRDIEEEARRKSAGTSEPNLRIQRVQQKLKERQALRKFLADKEEEIRNDSNLTNEQRSEEIEALRLAVEEETLGSE